MNIKLSIHIFGDFRIFIRIWKLSVFGYSIFSNRDILLLRFGFWLGYFGSVSDTDSDIGQNARSYFDDQSIQRLVLTSRRKLRILNKIN